MIYSIVLFGSGVLLIIVLVLSFLFFSLCCVLHKLMKNCCKNFFGRQGLPLRGHDDTESNFHQLLDLQKCHDPALAKWLGRKGDKYCSLEIQNETLKLCH